MGRFSTLVTKITTEQRRFYLTEMDGEPWYKRAFYAIICFFSVMVSEINSLKLFVRVASGTYTTMLALIPFTVVGGSLIVMVNKKTNVETISAMIRDMVIPVAGDTIGDFLTESLTRTLDIGLGPIGIISLLITSVMLFVYIEDCFNDIWHVVKKRAFYLRILLFYAVVTLGPILLSFSIYQATQLIQGFGMNGFVWKVLREIGLMFIVLLVVYKFLPNTRVQLKYAFIPAVICSILLEVIRFAFGLYFSVAFSSSYSILYGALGIIPVMLLWLYITWAIVLLGVETSYCMQNMRLLLLSKIYDTSTDENPWVFTGAYAPIEVLASMVRNLCAGREPQTADDLAIECVYPVLAIEAIMRRLEGMKIIKRVESETATCYILAKPLDSIAIQDIMNTFDESTPRAMRYPKLSALINELIQAQENIWQGKSLNSLREEKIYQPQQDADISINTRIQQLEAEKEQRSLEKSDTSENSLVTDQPDNSGMTTLHVD